MNRTKVSAVCMLETSCGMIDRLIGSGGRDAGWAAGARFA